MSKNIHVTPRSDGKWKVVVEKSTHVHTITNTQHDAIAKAKDLAKQNKSEVLIHGRNNLIRERNSYGHDPYPPKG